MARSQSWKGTELLQGVDEAAMNNAQRLAYDRLRVEALPWHTAEALLGKHVGRPEITDGAPLEKGCGHLGHRILGCALGARLQCPPGEAAGRQGRQAPTLYHQAALGVRGVGAFLPERPGLRIVENITVYVLMSIF